MCEWLYIPIIQVGVEMLMVVKLGLLFSRKNDDYK